MRKEYIVVKKQCGTKIKIAFSLISDYSNMFINSDIYWCEKRKRTYNNIINTDDYSWRRMSDSEKANFKIEERRKLIEDEVFEHYLNKFFEEIKPNIDEVR